MRTCWCRVSKQYIHPDHSLYCLFSVALYVRLFQVWTSHWHFCKGTQLWTDVSQSKQVNVLNRLKAIALYAFWNKHAVWPWVFLLSHWHGDTGSRIYWQNPLNHTDLEICTSHILCIMCCNANEQVIAANNTQRLGSQFFKAVLKEESGARV